MPARVTLIEVNDSASFCLRFLSYAPPSILTYRVPSTVAPPMYTGDDRRIAKLALGWVSGETSRSSVGHSAGTKVLEGGCRTGSGRRMGEEDAPFEGTLVLEDWGLGPCEAVDKVDATEFMCLDDLLSGMLDRIGGLPLPILGLPASIEATQAKAGLLECIHCANSLTELSSSLCTAPS